MDSEQILFQPDVISSICNNLEVEEVQHLLTAYKQITVNCPIRFVDKINKQTYILPGINPVTTVVYSLIQRYGFKIAFFKAVENGNESVISTFLKMGADVNDVRRNGETVLMAAARYGQKQIVKLLLRNGANVKIINNTVRTALMIAAEYGQIEIVSDLLDAGSPIDAVDVYGQTALMKAVKEGHVSTALILLDRGADLFKEDIFGDNVLNITDEANIPGENARNFIELLKERGLTL